MIASQPIIPESIEGQTQDGETQDTTKQAKILIVEDEAGIRDLLEELLFMEGYRITAVDNGSDGVSRFSEESTDLRMPGMSGWEVAKAIKNHNSSHDLVFTDLRMPGMSGWEVAKAIKNHNSRTPVVMVTGWDTETLRSELNDTGVDRVLQKPFDMDVVLDLVSELLNAA